MPSDDELRWHCQACDEIGWPFGSAVKLLLLTQRCDGVAHILDGTAIARNVDELFDTHGLC
jgi:hypothetical protein